MRKILFRGKVKGSDKNPDGLWVYGFPYQENDEWFILYDFAGAFGNGRMQKNEVIKETVGQFTGLTDKNGKEIFDGDLIKVIQFDSSYSVIFINGCYKLKHTREDLNGMIWGTLERLFELEHKYPFEVIGNIHDNPKLLNQ